MYADRRAPAANTSSTLAAGAARIEATNTTAPTYASPKIAHASECQTAEPQRALAIGANQRCQAACRVAIRRGALRVMRTSLPGEAVVISTNRCRARRLC